jgi:hypothetical protein
MTATPPFCGTHRAVLYLRGGTVRVGELTGIINVSWERLRDDISVASVTIAAGCCDDVLRQVRTLLFELHILRNDEVVWQGPITRLEFDWDTIGIFAEDLLWVAKRRVIERGWNFEKVPSASVLTAVDVTTYLMLDTYAGRHGDDWNVGPFMNAYAVPAKDQRCYSKVNAAQFTMWQILDDMARYYDLDYTVINRSVKWWDVHTNWLEVAPLYPDHIAQYPRLVEYGNQYGNRYFRTDGSGYYAMAQRPNAPYGAASYGHWVDILSNATNQDEEVPTDKPSANILRLWQESAEKGIDQLMPPPVSVIIPENSTLLPNSPWNINVLPAGCWFMVHYTHPCRDDVAPVKHKLNRLSVTESGDQGETISISTQAAPREEVLYP